MSLSSASVSCPDCGGVSGARGDGVPYRSKRFRDRDNLGASAERTGRRTYAVALGGEVRLLLPSHFAHFVGGKHRSNFESGPVSSGIPQRRPRCQTCRGLA